MKIGDLVVCWHDGRTAPEAYKAEVRQARYERDMAAGRLALAQEAAKRYETAMLELAGAQAQRAGAGAGGAGGEAVKEDR